ncbi:MAG: prolipoprotein diacylglyceryl transferase [Candidatus Accumulibacter sp.]|jgi:phosphatidylglycerol:prolipoprotein diacylglycerol transferase|nr:prolipoprotein diacylglyceryl transferase [Accumulibacter sp.]
MLIHPQFDPVAFRVGPLSIHWYALTYLFAFAQFFWLGRRRLEGALRFSQPAWTPEQFDDLLSFGAFGVVLGGRLGEVLFYAPGYYFSHPLEILAVWKGGMSFHGGFLGVLVAVGVFARKTGRNWFDLADFIAPLVPLGLAAGRVGNFINGELWGRVCDASLPWGMIFPRAGDALPRHPSQLYQALMEGVLLFVVLWIFSARERPRGAVSGAFLVGYGVFRFVAEYFRAPDDGIFGVSEAISMGQWLSLPMILAGVLLLFVAYRKRLPA